MLDTVALQAFCPLKTVKLEIIYLIILKKQDYMKNNLVLGYIKSYNLHLPYRIAFTFLLDVF